MSNQRHDPPQRHPLFGELKELADQDRDSTPATMNRRRIKAKNFLIMYQAGKQDPTGILANHHKLDI
jgi:hypothetical protein